MAEQGTYTLFDDQWHPHLTKRQLASLNPSASDAGRTTDTTTLVEG